MNLLHRDCVLYILGFLVERSDVVALAGVCVSLREILLNA
jgi:hypothetical protein